MTPPGRKIPIMPLISALSEEEKDDCRIYHSGYAKNRWESCHMNEPGYYQEKCP
jgi:hypothetical protein